MFDVEDLNDFDTLQALAEGRLGSWIELLEGTEDK